MVVTETNSISGSSFEKKRQQKGKQGESMLSSLLRRMNPGNCLCGESIDELLVVRDEGNCSDEAKMDAIIPGLLMAMDIENEGSPSQMNRELFAQAAALKSLYELSQYQNNRCVKI